tara:strand:- start:14586 stop:15161 length:576 start_codon:yes stop_codon:yes gene_type:complete
MLRFFRNEQWKEFDPGYDSRFRYAISNQGRLMSFKDEFKKGRILSGSSADGYRMFRYKIIIDEVTVNKHYFIHKLVAQQFLPEKKEDEEFVLHLDFNRINNNVENLKWATKAEMVAHNKNSPKVIQAKKNLLEFNIKRDGIKLTSTQVRLIKKLISNPNRKTRMRLIAKQFGISEMHLYRIKSGENWSSVK